MQDFYRPLCKMFGLVSKMNKAQFLTIGSLEVQGGRCTVVILCDEHRKKESEVAQSCPILCDPEDYSLPGSSVHGILQARILEWVTISFSRGSSRPRDRAQVSYIGGRRFNLWPTREARDEHNNSSFRVSEWGKDSLSGEEQSWRMLMQREGGTAFWVGGRFYKPQVMRRRELEGRVSSERGSGCGQQERIWEERMGLNSPTKSFHFIL